MKNIAIVTIPHKHQAYPTVGNYTEKEGITLFEISQMKDWRFEMLVALHEFIEYLLVKHRGIKISDIDEFDKLFEKEREMGLHSDSEEPGFDPYAPYLKEHAFATKVERMMAKELGVDWDKYDKTIGEL